VVDYTGGEPLDRLIREPMEIGQFLRLSAVSDFPDELYPAPKSWAERAHPKLIHYNKLPKGGHFAAWEQPKLFSEEARAGFRSLR
jgi:pimeloyl-ACP methyl ester carboxylesterase